MTHIFRELKILSQSDLNHLEQLFPSLLEKITSIKLKTADQILSQYIEFFQAIAERSKNDNPYQAFEENGISRDENGINLKSYNDIFDYYINYALPNLLGRHFFFVIKYDFLSPLVALQSCLTLFEDLQDHDDSNELIEITNLSLIKYQAILDATVEFERQQFGEDVHE